jgi:hypothetical protein
MNAKNSITNKLQKIVKQRNTSILIKKQEIYYKPVRTTRGSLVTDSYSFTDE